MEYGKVIIPQIQERNIKISRRMEWTSPVQQMKRVRYASTPKKLNFINTESEDDDLCFQLQNISVDDDPDNGAYSIINMKPMTTMRISKSICITDTFHQSYADTFVNYKTVETAVPEEDRDKQNIEDVPEVDVVEDI